MHPVLLGGRSHEAVYRDVVVFVFGGGGSGCGFGKRLLGGNSPSGVLNWSYFCGPRFIDSRGRGRGGGNGGFAFAFGDWGGCGFGVRRGVDEDDACLGPYTGWVYRLFLTALDLLAFEVYDLPFELAGPSGGDGNFSGWGVYEGLGASVAEVEFGRLFDVGGESFTVGFLEVDDFGFTWKHVNELGLLELHKFQRAFS